MANTHLPVDIYSDFNKLIDNVVGSGSAVAVNLSHMITVGQATQMYGYENTLNKLSIAMGRVLIAVRPYTSRFGLIEQDSEQFGQLTRKISYFADEFEDSQNWNGTQAGDKLVDGKSIDHYTIKKRYPLEVWFGGNKVLQKHYTRFRNQLKVAFSNAADFARFYEGEATQINNEIQMMKEIENRALVINHIGALYNGAVILKNLYPTGMARNMTKEFNDKYGTAYTSAELLSTHLKEFTQFFASVLKYQSDLLEQASELYHCTPSGVTGDGSKTLHLWRHTPKADQRLMLASSVLYDMESTVYSEIFHDGYLKPEQAERVPFWLNPSNPLSLENLNTINYMQKDGKVASATINITKPLVLGLMFDKNALAVTYRQEDVVTTPVNGAGDYYNTFYHWSKDYRADFTENAVLFYMEDTAA